MEINYLTMLNNNHTVIDKYDNTFSYVLEPLTEAQIVSLEATYNNSTTFPAALRELLYLAGTRCYVLDYGLDGTQTTMQEDTRNYIARFNLTIRRPFYVIDVYNIGSQCLFVYMDEGNDPAVYSAVFWGPPEESIDSLNKTLSELINSRLTILLSGGNPW